MRFAFLLKPVGISSDVGRDLIFTGVILHFWVIGISAFRTTVIGVHPPPLTIRIIKMMTKISATNPCVNGVLMITSSPADRPDLHPGRKFHFVESGSVF